MASILIKLGTDFATLFADPIFHNLLKILYHKMD